MSSKRAQFFLTGDENLELPFRNHQGLYQSRRRRSHCVRKTNWFGLGCFDGAGRGAAVGVGDGAGAGTGTGAMRVVVNVHY